MAINRLGNFSIDMEHTPKAKWVYWSLLAFFAILCKTTTGNDQILRCLENVKTSANFLNFYFKFTSVFRI